MNSDRGGARSSGVQRFHGSSLDIGVVSAANHHLAGFRQTTNDKQDGFLFVFHLRQTDWATVGKVVAQDICRTLRHVAQELLAQRLLGTFEGDKQRLGVHFLEEALDAAIVHFDQVFEQEHLVDNFLCQLAVEFADGGNDRLFLLRFHQVDDLCRRSHAAHFAALEVLAIEQVVQHFGQLRQRGWLDTTEGRDTQHHIVTQALFEQRQNIGRLATFEVDKNGGDNLRVLVADKVGGTLRLHKVERLNTAGGIARFQNVFQQAGGTLFAQRLDQHGAQIVVGVDVERGKLFGFLLKFRQHFRQLFVRDLAYVCHCRTENLYFALGEVFEHLGRTVFANGHQQDDAFIGA
ncbi:hypothetical protein EcWSU1_02881 [Enterobacter ludwigii]|uniref:Uncharacterized protein n=1 Tax=Enterobacter ludwigii TaxID=299767 RepID=G8LHY7_9ENTR|nr:hypothetical protein EcWSU1_02881 [Enterobacter ludwigii]